MSSSYPIFCVKTNTKLKSSKIGPSCLSRIEELTDSDESNIDSVRCDHTFKCSGPGVYLLKTIKSDTTSDTDINSGTNGKDSLSEYDLALRFRALELPPEANYYSHCRESKVSDQIRTRTARSCDLSLLCPESSETD